MAQAKTKQKDLATDEEITQEDVETEEASETKPSPARALSLSAVDFQMKETVIAEFCAKPPPGITREQVLEPNYWRHVAAQMPSMSIIHIIPKDGSWYGRYLVCYADKLMARIVELEWKKLPVITPDEVAGKLFGVDYMMGEGFRVIRHADGVVLSKNHNSAVDAEDWLNNHSRAAA